MTNTTTEKATLSTWTSEAGPRQTKDVEKAIRDLLRAGSGTLEKSNFMSPDGTVKESEMIVSRMGQKTEAEKAHKQGTIEALNKINTKYAGTITRANCRDIIEAVRAEIPGRRVAQPVNDKRKTREALEAERAERLEASKRAEQREEERKAKAKKELEEFEQNTDYKHLEKLADSKKSRHALAAANVRRELKKLYPGHKFSVTSESYSMGSSLRVHWENGPTVSAVSTIINKYEYGSFDGMDDMYNHKQGADRLFSNVYGSVKYASASRTVDQEIRDRVTADYKEEHTPGNLEGRELQRSIEQAVHTIIYDADFYNKGAYKGIVDANKPKDGKGAWCPKLSLAFEELPAVPQTQTATATASGCTIEKHVHTKRGYDIYIVILSARVDRDEFNDLRDAAKAAGGWYSRKWGTTPAGFAFKEEAKAQAFAASISPDTTPDGSDTPTKTKPAADRIAAKAEKLRGMAEKMQGEVVAKRAPMNQNPTPKRTLEYKRRLIDADHIERTANALQLVAEHIERGDCPQVLASITKKAALDGLSTRLDTSRGYYEISDTGEYLYSNPVALALQALLINGQTEEQEAETAKRAKDRDIENKILAFAGQKIPGFFVTHSDTARRMVYEADLKPTDRVLEPSAGTGNLADLAAPDCAEVVCVEIRPALAEILKLKGYPTANEDFTRWARCMQFNEATGKEELPLFDKIIMNPPFEKGQDIDHVREAYHCLKEGGRLVAIMGEGAFFRSDCHAVQFRDWLDSIGGTSEKLPEGSFAKAGEVNRTGVNARIVIIEK